MRALTTMRGSVADEEVFPKKFCLGNFEDATKFSVSDTDALEE